MFVKYLLSKQRYSIAVFIATLSILGVLIYSGNPRLLNDRLYEDNIISDQETYKRPPPQGATHCSETKNLPNANSNFSITKDGKEIRIASSPGGYRIWHFAGESHRCYLYKTRYAIDLNMVYLVSFPGSGNTWLRYLIEGASGIFTGSTYSDNMLYKGGMRGEYQNKASGKTLTQKTHGATFRKNTPTEGFWGYDTPVVLLIRNPAEAIISIFNLRKTKKHTSIAPQEIFNTTEFRKFVPMRLKSWEDVVFHGLLGTTKPVYVIHYEYLKKDIPQELYKLLDFLQVPVEKGRMDCVTEFSRGKFKRNSTEKFDPYTAQDKSLMLGAVKRVNQLMRALGYPEPPLYPPF